MFFLKFQKQINTDFYTWIDQKNFDILRNIGWFKVKKWETKRLGVLLTSFFIQAVKRCKIHNKLRDRKLKVDAERSMKIEKILLEV